MVNEREQCADQLMVKVGQINQLTSDLQVHESVSQIDQARQALSEVQSFLDNNRPLIPQYCLKSAVESMKKLQSIIDRPSNKKIQFKFKAQSKTIEAKPNQDTGGEESSLKDDPISTISPDSTNGFANLTNRDDLSLEGDEIRFKSINLIKLSACEVKILNIVDTVYIMDLKDTKVLVLLAARAITIADCSNCKFRLVCQQLRIKSTTNCKFEIFTSARSMLESSKDLEFSPLKLDSPDLGSSRASIEGLMAEAKFDRERNNWNHIDDFDWLSPSVPSKNYKLLDT